MAKKIVSGQAPKPIRTAEDARLSVELNKVPDPEEIQARIDANREKWIALLGPEDAGTDQLQERIQDAMLIREANRSRSSLPSGFQSLYRELAKGNLQPGLGTKSIVGSVMEARGRSGARVYFRPTAEGVEVVALSTKSNQRKVIDRLMEIYGS